MYVRYLIAGLACTCLLAGCSLDDVSGDTRPPGVASVSPRDGAGFVPVTTEIVITFNELIDSASVPHQPLSFSPAVSGVVRISDREIAFTPDRCLSCNTTYAVTLATGIRDRSGNATSQTYTWQFATRQAVGTVAYVHSMTSGTASSFKDLLDCHHLPTTLVEMSQSMGMDWSTHDIIIIGPATGSPGDWGTQELVNSLAGSDKPILGTGEGGHAFFGKLSLAIGYPNGESGTGTAVKILDFDHSILHSPNDIIVPPGSTLVLCQSASDYVGVRITGLPTPLDLIARGPGDHWVFPLIAEKPHYMLWGFAAGPADLTPTGQDLFVNAVANMIAGR